MRLLAWWDGMTILPRSPRSVLGPEAPYDAAVERLRALEPHVVYSYGSYADGFFRFARSRRLEFPVPRVWMYGGDALDPGSRAVIEQAYGCRTYSTYQAVETGRLGFQCERRAGFHLNVDLCAVRLIDDAGLAVPPGQEGEVVISNLHNRGMVLLNYRLGDRAVWSDAPCPCGRSLPMIEHVAGRTTEMLRFGDGREVSSFVVKHLFRHELERALQVQIVHAEPGCFTWRIVPFSTAECGAMRDALVERGRQIFGEGVEIGVEFVDAIALTAGGKLRAVVPSDANGSAP
jgi:phenylacetate-CoA ligase